MRRRFFMTTMIVVPCLGQRFPRPPRPAPKPPVRQPNYDPPVKNVPSGPGGKENPPPNPKKERRKQQEEKERQDQQNKRDKDRGKLIQPDPRPPKERK